MFLLCWLVHALSFRSVVFFRQYWQWFFNTICSGQYVKFVIFSEKNIALNLTNSLYHSADAIYVYFKLSLEHLTRILAEMIH